MKFLALASLVLSSGPLLAAATTGVLVPLYYYPDVVYNDNCSAWQTLFSSIQNFPNVPFTVIVNPNSGPGGAPGSQPDTQTQGCLETLLASGKNVKTVGYVRTNYTNRAVADVETDINAYGNWSAAYKPLGIFFDEATYDGAHAATYTSYASYARAHGLNTVVFNPGTEVTSSAYFTADIVLTAEDPYSSFKTSQLTLNSTYPAAKQAVVLYAAASSPSSLITTLVNDGVGWLYFTDETAPNPYTGTPSYWATEVSQINAANAAKANKKKA